MSEQPQRLDSLILVPTAFELDHLKSLDDFELPDSSSVEICGLGPILAASRTSQLISALKPQRVLLIGIAGVYEDRLEIGQAYEFTRVSMYGIGAGQGEQFQTASELGWSDFNSADPPIDIDETIDVRDQDSHRSLLTVCSVATSDQEIGQRLAKYSSACAEDMEGYGVAVSCHLNGIPLSIFRGVSNRAGDRDHRNWQIGPAMQAVWKMARCQWLQAADKPRSS